MDLPMELTRAVADGRLLVLWGESPFPLEERPPANRALALNGWLAQAGTVPLLPVPLPELPPLPILSLDPGDRLERAFEAAGIPLTALHGRRDVITQGRHNLLKLAGDLETRHGVILSRGELRDLQRDGDKRYLLDEARRAAGGGALLLLGCDPAGEDFQAWWPVLAPAFRGVPIYALGEPAAPWPEGVACLEMDWEAVVAALLAAHAASEAEGATVIAPRPGAPRVPEERRREVHTFEITIQRKSGQGWPVVARYRGPDHPQPVRDEGMLYLDKETLLAKVTPLDYGIELGKALFHGEEQREVLEGFQWAMGKSDDYLHVTLLVEAQDLRTLRWERLCAFLERRWRHLALDQRTPFAIAVPTIAARRFPPIERRDLKVLLVVASPDGLERYRLDPFDARRAVASVRAALGEIDCDVLATLPGERELPTLDRIVDRFTTGGYTLLHVVCHGSYLETGDTALYLATEENEVDPVAGERLIQRLGLLPAEGSVPYFAFLATCDSASPEAEGALGGLAQRLLREVGMPAIVGMTDKVPVEMADALAEQFYRRLRRSGEVDRALVEALAPLTERYGATVPALFSRLGGEPLFQVAPEGPAPGPPAPEEPRPYEPPAPSPTGPSPSGPDPAAVRDLLLAAFTASDLRRLFLYTSDPELRPLRRHFSPGDGLTTMVDKTIEYCLTYALLPNLLREVERANPRQYARFAPQLGAAGSQRPATATPATPTTAPARPDLGAMRRRLDGVFDDAQLDAFCLDHFPEVYDRFSRGMRKDEKITLLLDRCRRDAGRWAQLEGVVGG